MRGYPEITAAMTVTGGADALLHVRARDVEHFEEVLERIRAEPFIRKTISVMVLSHLIPDSPEAGRPCSHPRTQRTCADLGYNAAILREHAAFVACRARSPLLTVVSTPRHTP